MGNQTLVLQSLGRNASGSYYCVATNSEGFTLSNAVHLDVKCKLIDKRLCIIHAYIYKLIVFYSIEIYSNTRFSPFTKSFCNTIYNDYHCYIIWEPLICNIMKNSQRPTKGLR